MTFKKTNDWIERLWQLGIGKCWSIENPIHIRIALLLLLLLLLLPGATILWRPNSNSRLCPSSPYWKKETKLSQLRYPDDLWGEILIWDIREVPNYILDYPFVFLFVLVDWSLLLNALWPFNIYCAPQNFGIRM